MTQEFFDAYKVLGVEPKATAEELKAAYLRLARTHHPDIATAVAVPRDDPMRQINLAYGLVGRPGARQRYDNLRRAYMANRSLRGLEDVWLGLMRAAGRVVGGATGGSYRVGYVIGRWLRP